MRFLPVFDLRQSPSSGWRRSNRSRQIDANAFLCVWLKLTIMKLASRKNMMSISG